MNMFDVAKGCDQIICSESETEWQIIRECESPLKSLIFQNEYEADEASHQREKSICS
jgi:hypothetical protein